MIDILETYSIHAFSIILLMTIYDNESDIKKSRYVDV